MGAFLSRNEQKPGCLAPDAMEAWGQQTLAADVLREIVSACDAAGIDVLPVKGVITSRRLYGDVAERPIADVDLRVRPEDLGRLRALGRAAGWYEDLWSRAYGMLSFVIADMLVEVEAQLGPPAMCATPIAELIGRAERRSDPFGFAHLEPELHDHCLLTCINAFKDKLTQVPKASLQDLARFVEVPGFDAATLVSRARRGGVETIVWIVADWMLRERGAARWAAVKDCIGPVAPRRGYAALFARLVDKSKPPSIAMRLVARFANDDARHWPRAVAAMAWRAAEERGIVRG